MKDWMHPVAPSTGICASAHSSLNYFTLVYDPLKIIAIWEAYRDDSIRRNLCKGIKDMIYATVVQCCWCFPTINSIVGIVDSILASKT